jgi:predicted metal-dependent HD superfamily phosphohydrolase
MLEKVFTSLVANYCDDAQLSAGLWGQLNAAYTSEERYFHNVSHLQQMHATLLPFQSQIDDWDSLLFAVFYHDLVYDVVRYVTENDNEDKSAEEAEKVLFLINFPPAKIKRCKQHILATKTHKQLADTDTNFLIDADLAILGQPWEAYEVYRKAIRKEYEIYPDSIYNAGRVTVLKKFLRSKRLFITQPFFEEREATARENMERELEILSFF